MYHDRSNILKLFNKIFRHNHDRLDTLDYVVTLDFCFLTILKYMKNKTSIKKYIYY